MIAVVRKIEEPDTGTWQERFLQMLPQIEKQGRAAFRDLDAEAREDAVAETVANAMCAFRRLHERGELRRAFASALTRYAVAQVRSGRKVGTSQCSRDVYSLRAKKRAGYEVLPLGTPGEQASAWMEYLIDDRRTPVPDQAAFRIDYPRWLNEQTPRNRQIAERLSVGYSANDVAKEFALSPGRVSQLRRELAASWYAFINASLGPVGTDEAD